MALAACAALLAVARIAVARTTGSPETAADPAVRAATEAHALVATMQHNTTVVFDALEVARARQRASQMRCADEAMSRADVALRHACEDAAALDAAVATHDAKPVDDLLARLRLGAAASHQAVVSAASCSLPDEVRPVEGTRVTVTPPLLPRLDP